MKNENGWPIKDQNPQSEQISNVYFMFRRSKEQFMFSRREPFYVSSNIENIIKIYDETLPKLKKDEIIDIFDRKDILINIKDLRNN
jgi:hypothetical protein